MTTKSKGNKYARRCEEKSKPLSEREKVLARSGWRRTDNTDPHGKRWGRRKKNEEAGNLLGIKVAVPHKFKAVNTEATTAKKTRRGSRGGKGK